MAKSYLEQQVEKQRKTAEQIYRMSGMFARPKRVTAEEMAAGKKAREQKNKEDKR